MSTLNPSMAEIKSSIQRSSCIDQKNLSVLTSAEYLKNYTYLQFTLFPELFQLYVMGLSSRQLLSLLDSYVGTFLDFYAEGMLNSKSYQGWIVQGVKQIKDRHQTNHRLELKETKQMYNSYDQYKQLLEYDNRNWQKRNTELQEQIQRIGQQISLLKNIHKKLQDNKKDTQYLYQEVNTLINFVMFLPRGYHENKSKNSKIFTDPLLSNLLRLICYIYFQLIAKSPHSIVHCYIPKYLLHLIMFSTIFKFKSQFDQKYSKNSVQQDLRKKDLKLLILLRLMPIFVEIAEFYSLVINGKVRMFYLMSGNINKLIIENYINFIEISADVFELITEEQNLQNANFCEVKDCQYRTFVQMARVMIDCLKKEITLKNQELSAKNTSQFSKELSTQNVQKIAKLLSMIQLNQFSVTKDNIQIMELQVLHQKSDDKFALQFHQKQTLQKQYFFRRDLSQQFLQTYFRIQGLIDEAYFITKEENDPDLQQLLGNLLGINYQKLSRLLCLEDKGRQLKQKVRRTELQANASIELLTMLINTNQKAKQESTQTTNYLPLFSKSKHSLLVNLITTKLLTSLLDATNCTRPQTIRQMFQQVLELSQQYVTYPSLQSVFYLLSAIQLWYQISKVESQNQKNNDISKKISQISKNQVEIFFDSVIRQYSQQNVKIHSEQLQYVKWIIMMFEIVKETGQRNIIKNDVKKICDRINHLSQSNKINKNSQSFNFFKEEHFTYSTIVSHIQLVETLQEFLEVIMLRLVNWCFCFDRFIQNYKENTENDKNSNYSFKNFKLPFWKIVQMNFLPLNGAKFTEYIKTQIIDPLHRLHSPLISPTAINILDQQKSFQNLQQIYRAETIQSVYELYDLFIVMKKKYILSLQFREYLLGLRRDQFQMVEGKNRKDIEIEIEQDGNQNFIEQQRTDCRLSGIWRSAGEQSMQFLLGLTSNIWQSLLPMPSIMLHQPAIQDHLNFTSQSISQLVNSIQQKIISNKILIYKLSFHQIYLLLKYESTLKQQQFTEWAKIKMLEKVDGLNKVFDALLGVGIVGIALIQWVKMQMTLRLQNQSESPIQKASSQSSSFDLLRLINLLSWLTPYFPPIQLNFEQLQSLLPSNITPNESTFAKLHFPFLQLSSITKKQLSFCYSYEFLQLIYEYIPFDIHSIQQEKQLFTLCKDIVLSEQNHQYFSDLKREKIDFLRLKRFLEWIQKVQ